MAKVKDIIGELVNSVVDELNINPELFVAKETGKSLVQDNEITKLSITPIISVSATEPQNPVVGQIWIDIS